MRRSWSPILEGELREQALAAVADTVARVRRERTGFPDVALGMSGFALLLMEASRVRPRLASQRDIDRVVSRILPEVAARPLTPGLYDGYTGVALTLDLLRRARRTRVGGGDDIDRALLASVERFPELPPHHASLDLISGLAGQALYACERLPRARARRTLELIVGWLEQRALAVDGGAAWLSPPDPGPQPRQLPGSIFDLGVAHGVPGIVAVLARVVEAGVAARPARRLLQAGARWLVAQRQERSGPAFDVYAPSAPAADPAAAVPPRPARPTWCYGDPGVAIALLSAARALRDRRLHETALAVLRRVAAVRADPSIEDASLCHGAAGLLHMFTRLFHATGEPGARDAAIFWAERTLLVRAGPCPIADEPVFAPGAPPLSPLRFLMGASGSALALLAAATPSVPLWDRIMLLDLPVRPSQRARAAARSLSSRASSS